MASTNSTVDGMGFEEINQVQQQASNLWLTGSVRVNLAIGSTGSFVNGFVDTLTTVTSTAATTNATTGSLTNIRVTTPTTTEGILRSVQAGSPVAYGGFVKAGSLETSAGSVGFVQFGTSFASKDGWYVNLTPCGSEQGISDWYLSGLRHASGINMVGAPALRYDWIAVGINT